MATWPFLRGITGRKSVCICGSIASECPFCSSGKEEAHLLHSTLEQAFGAFEHNDPAPAAKRCAEVCSAYYPFASREWAKRRIFTRIAYVAAAVVVFLGMATVFFTNNAAKPVSGRSVDFASLTVGEMAREISQDFHTKVIVSPDARDEVFLKRATVKLKKASLERTVNAVAATFGLAVEQWDGAFVLRSMRASMLESNKARTEKLDISLLVEPDEFAALEYSADKLIALEGPRFTAVVAERARIHNFKDEDTDVTVISRPDDRYIVSRQVPRLVINRHSGNIEFTALDEYDFKRFFMLRAIMAGRNSDGMPLPKDLGPMLDKLPVIDAGTIDEAILQIAQKAGFDVAFGTGVAMGLPAPAMLKSARTVGEALDILMTSRPFTFVWLAEKNLMLIDDRAALQRYLFLGAIPIRKGTTASETILELDRMFGQYFHEGDNRTGSLRLAAMDRIIVRHHAFQLYRILSFFNKQ